MKYRKHTLLAAMILALAMAISMAAGAVPLVDGTNEAGETFSFLLAGDPQLGAGGDLEKDRAAWEHTLLMALNAWDGIEFLVTAGDNVNSSDSEEEYEAFLGSLERVGLPLAPSVGNHDNAASYREHFNPPNQDNKKGATKAGGDYWYTWGGALFLHLNSNRTDMLAAWQHRAFIKAAIAQNPDAVWRIAVFHHSIYSAAAGRADGSDARARRRQYVPIFDGLGIDAVFMGHDHNYCRTEPMRGGEPDPTGILYLTANSASGSKYYNLAEPLPAWAAVASQERAPSITKVDVTPESLTVTTVRTDTFEVIDAYTLLKTEKPPMEDSYAVYSIAGAAVLVIVAVAAVLLAKRRKL